MTTRERRPCAAPGCGRADVLRRGLCQPHYRRLMRRQMLTTSRPATLLGRIFADVGEWDGCVLWVGRADAHGRPWLRWHGRVYRPDRSLWEAAHGRVLHVSERLVRSCGEPMCIDPEHGLVD